MRLLLPASLVFAAVTPAHAAPKAPLVLAAASLQESLTAAADVWAAKGHPRPILSFAASSALARQVEAGAPADLFISADEQWMDELAKHNLLIARTRQDVAGNRLVLVASITHPVHIAIKPRFGLAAVLGAGHLAMADPESVPAGIYGKQALTNLGVWASIEARVARAENVRAALLLVDRGEVPLGIVYATDAKADAHVMIAGVFPANAHPPIRYPLARLTASTSADAEGFRRYLLSPGGQAIFIRYGFSAPR